MHSAEEYNNGIITIKKGELQYLQFENLSKYKNLISHCFTTRKGGISQGAYTSLNLSFNKEDESRQNVIKNYKIISEAINIDYTNLVLSNQIHDNKVKYVTESDRGKGIVRDSDIIGYDAMITDKRQVPLVTFYADCVPVFFFDPVKVVIGLAHSGWKSTLKEIASNTLKSLIDEFNCNPADVEVAIGPSIGYCCFEVGIEVYKEFESRFDFISGFSSRKNEDHWNINLQGIIKNGLMKLGVKSEKIIISGICTKCNKNVYFSHRGDNGKTGTMAAIMTII